MVKINLTEKQINLIVRLINLNCIDTNIEEYKEDKEFYEELKEDRRTAIQIRNKFIGMIY